MSVNFNASTPAAPAGSTNVTFQRDVSGNISGYVPSSAPQLTSVNLTAQTANISATDLVAAASVDDGVYRISSYIIVTSVGTTSTLPSVAITWTDKDNSTSQTKTLTPTNAGNALTTYEQSTMILDAKDATAIQYATASYASTGSAMQYALHIRVERLA